MDNAWGTNGHEMTTPSLCAIDHDPVWDRLLRIALPCKPPSSHSPDSFLFISCHILLVPCIAQSLPHNPLLHPKPRIRPPLISQLLRRHPPIHLFHFDQLLDLHNHTRKLRMYRVENRPPALVQAQCCQYVARALGHADLRAVQGDAEEGCRCYCGGHFVCFLCLVGVRLELSESMTRGEIMVEGQTELHRRRRRRPFGGFCEDDRVVSFGAAFAECRRRAGQ